MELAGPESRARLRKEGSPLKLISTGRPSKATQPFLGARSHLLGEYHSNSQRGPQLSELSFSSAQLKVAGQVFLLCGVSSSLVHSSASPFLLLRDIVLALFTREAVRRLQSICGKMLPDNTVVCDSEGKLILSAWDLLVDTFFISYLAFCIKPALYSFPFYFLLIFVLICNFSFWD